MDALQYQQPAIDPAFGAIQQRAEQDRLSAIQTDTGMMTASLLARYGSAAAIKSATGGPDSSAMPMLGGMFSLGSQARAAA